MAADSHVRIHDQIDEELPTIKPNIHKQPRSNKCLVYILATIVIASIVMLILGLTLLRFNSPDVKLGRVVEIKNLQYGTTPSSPSLNMIMVAELTIDNTNYGRFKFHSSNMSVLYGDVTVGLTNINGGVVKARGTKRMKITTKVRANTIFLKNTSFSSDIGSGIVMLSSYTKLRGELQAIKIIKRCRTAIMDCSMKLNLTSQAFQELRCL